MKRSPPRFPEAVVLALSISIRAIAEDSPPPNPPPVHGIAPPTRIPYAETIDPVHGTPVDIATVPRAVRRAVVADAARRFKIDESAVVVTQAEQVTWSDGSLGCAEPGRFYTQMIVPGFRLVAKTSRGSLVYHTDTRGNVASCSSSARVGAQKLADPPAKPRQPTTQPPFPTPDR